jgi:hypothetical protein
MEAPCVSSGIYIKLLSLAQAKDNYCLWQQEWCTTVSGSAKSVVPFITLTLAVLFVTMLLVQGIPWLITYPQWTGMLLFSHEIHYSPDSQTLRFFDPSSIHTFFPLTYAFSRIYFLLVPIPLLAEFVLPASIQFILLALLAGSWLRRLPRELYYLAIYAVGVVSLYCAQLNPFLWFRSIGVWELIVFLTIFGTPFKNVSRSTAVVFILLLLSILFGDDGIEMIVAATFLALQVILATNGRRLYSVWLGFTVLIYVSYESAIGFAGASYYGGYLPSLLAQISEIISRDFNVAQQVNTYSSSLARVITLDGAFATLFILIPIVLFFNGIRNGISAKKFLIPGLVLILGLLLRASFSLTGKGAVFGSYFVHLFSLVLPVTVLGLLRSLSTPNKARLRVGQVRHPLAVAGAVFACVLVLVDVGLVIPVGSINTSVDPRVLYSYMPASGVFVQTFALGPITTESISDLTTIFINAPTNDSPYMLVSSVPSAFSSPPILTTHSIYYSSGPILIIKK